MNVRAALYLQTPGEVDMFNDFWKALEADRQKRYGPRSTLGSGLAGANIAQANAQLAEKSQQL